MTLALLVGTTEYMPGWKRENPVMAPLAPIENTSAQNLALDRATGDWVLWLNPDEELLPAGLAQLPDLLARPDAFAYVVRVQEVMDPEQPDRAPEMLRPRLFRRHPAVRFIGRLHPHFATPLEAIVRQENGQPVHERPGGAAPRLPVGPHGREIALGHSPARTRAAGPSRPITLSDRIRPQPPPPQRAAGTPCWPRRPISSSAATTPAAPTPTAASLLEYALSVSPEQSLCRLTARSTSS